MQKQFFVEVCEVDGLRCLFVKSDTIIVSWNSGCFIVYLGGFLFEFIVFLERSEEMV